jgi:hypothetical protein
MKLKKIKLLTAMAFGAVIAFTGCSKDDGAISNRVSIEDVPVVSMNFETGAANVLSATVVFSTSSTFQGKFKTSLFFDGAVAPTKVDIVVRKNSMTTITGTATNANVKVFKADISTFPAIFSITTAELATLFGTAVAANDAYDFAPDIYVGTKKYEAFPAASSGTGSGPAGMSTIGFGEYVRYWFK